MTRRLFILFLLGLTTMIAFASQENTPTTPTKIRVLIVDGFSNHDWKLTTQFIRAIIEPTGYVETGILQGLGS